MTMNNNDLLKPKMSDFIPADMVQQQPSVESNPQTVQVNEPTIDNNQETNIEPNLNKQTENVYDTYTGIVPKTAKDDAFISEDFDSFMKSLNEQQQPVTSNDTSVDDLLKNIKVDLNSIEISNGNILNLERTENLFKNKRMSQVVACQSAYTAYMSALNNQELQNILGSDEDYYSYRKRIIKLIFKHMEDTSIGKLDFLVWEKLTSFLDIETLLYGIYCQTFPYENTYNIICPNKSCRHRYTTIANNNTIVEVKSKDETFVKLQEILKTVRNPQECMDKSLVHTTKRIVCEESKMIVDIRIPSVYDYLEGILSKVTPTYAEEYSSSLSMAIFISKIYIPDLATLKDTGKLTYFEISDQSKIVEYLSAISFLDAEFITNEINDYTEKFRVYYSLKDVTCPECNEVIPEVQLSMEDLLFHTLRTIRSGKAKKA